LLSGSEISNQSSFSGSEGFNSNPVGNGSFDGVRGVIGIDGTSQSIIGVLSSPSGGGRREDLALRKEVMVDKKRLRVPLASGFASGSGDISIVNSSCDRSECYVCGSGGGKKERGWGGNLRGRSGTGVFFARFYGKCFPGRCNFSGEALRQAVLAR